MFTTDTITFLEFDQRVWIVLRGSEAFWLSAFSTPSHPFTTLKKPVMYAQRIKLKAHNYPSQQSEDSDPVTAEDKRGSRTMKEATVSPLIPTDRLEWV